MSDKKYEIKLKRIVLDIEELISENYINHSARENLETVLELLEKIEIWDVSK